VCIYIWDWCWLGGWLQVCVVVHIGVYSYVGGFWLRGWLRVCCAVCMGVHFDVRLMVIAWLIASVLCCVVFCVWVYMFMCDWWWLRGWLQVCCVVLCVCVYMFAWGWYWLNGWLWVCCVVCMSVYISMGRGSRGSFWLACKIYKIYSCSVLQYVSVWFIYIYIYIFIYIYIYMYSLVVAVVVCYNCNHILFFL